MLNAAATLMRQAMPALLFVALLQATMPALARGLAPVCTAQGVRWEDPAGTDRREPDPASSCAHGWCTPRKPRTGPGAEPR